MKDKGKNFLFVVNFVNQSISFTSEKATDENHLRVQIKSKLFKKNETLDWDRHRMYF
jgi:stress-induced morphogen